MLTKMRNNLVVSILGRGIIIGAMTQVVDISVLVIFAVGLAEFRIDA